MAVLILALGLLGIGAVIPVVVDQQRRGAEATFGVAAAASAEHVLASRIDLNRLWADVTQIGLTPKGWGVWLEDLSWPDASPPEAYYWDARNESGGVELDTGVWSLGTGNDAVELTVLSRLYPPPSAVGSVPRYVWDIVPRRVDVGGDPSDPLAQPGGPRQLQLAIFVRRIDSGIRVPRDSRNLTLLDVLAQVGVSSSERRSPVAVDSNGRPTRTGADENGNPNYALPLALGVDFDATQRDRLRLLDVLFGPTGTTGAVARELARQTGQRLVDNLGNVYTVIGRQENDPDVVLIDPTVPAWVPDPASLPTDRQHRSVVQVVFTPQVPAAVRIVTLTPPPVPREPVP